MNRRHHHNPFPAYTDLMLSIVGVTAMVMTLLLIRPVTQMPKDFHPKAEYLVTLTWDDHRDVDLDLWLESPEGNIVYYKNKELPNIALDRDSLGYASNVVTNIDGSIAASANQEIISIRAIMPGQYVAAVSYYAGQDEQTHTPYADGDPRMAIDGKVELLKVNPTVTLVASVTLHLTRIKETHNAIAFVVDSSGDVHTVELPAEDIIKKHIQAGAPG